MFAAKQYQRRIPPPRSSNFHHFIGQDGKCRFCDWPAIEDSSAYRHYSGLGERTLMQVRLYWVLLCFFYDFFYLSLSLLCLVITYISNDCWLVGWLVL